jgi:hypothetical protein
MVSRFMTLLLVVFPVKKERMDTCSSWHDISGQAVSGNCRPTVKSETAAVVVQREA